MSRNFFQN